MNNETKIDDNRFFEMPGLYNETIRFKKLLKMSDHNDHILIKGPRGSGKSYFTQVFKNHYSNKREPYTVNCATIPPDLMASELFGYAKGAFTGADTSKKGIIETAFDNNQQPILLEEFNSLKIEHQAQLLVYLETGNFFPVGDRTLKNGPVRIIATMNYENNTDVRQDTIDRFKIVVDVPPLYKRRFDIFTFIENRYPDLKFDIFEIIALFFYNWPGNLRELDQILYEMKAGLGLTRSILIPTIRWIRDVLRTLILNGYKESDLREIHEDFYNILLPYCNLFEIDLKYFENSCKGNKMTKRLSIKKDKINSYMFIFSGVDSENIRNVNLAECSLLFDILLDLQSIYSEKSLFTFEAFSKPKSINLLSPIGFITESFLQACKNIYLHKHKLNETDPNKQINPDQAIDYLLSLGSYSNVVHFIHKGCLSKFRKQKDLSKHWQISESTLSSRIKKFGISD